MPVWRRHSCRRRWSTPAPDHEGDLGDICRCVRRPGWSIMFARLASLLAISAFDLGANRRRADLRPHARLALDAAEEAAPWLLEDLELGLVLAHTELIESKALGLFDRLSCGFNPLHVVSQRWMRTDRPAQL